MIALAWIIFAVLIILVVLFCFTIVKYYQDRHEAEALPTIVTTIALCLSLFCVFLIPVDIYSVSSTVDSHGNKLFTPEEIEARTSGIRVIYYILYSAILAFAFGIIPFSYFFYEEDDEDATFKRRCWGGCKYTIFIIVIVVILLAVGLFLNLVPASSKGSTEATKEWALKIAKDSNFAESAISFSIACLTVLGYVCWITYTAYGFSGFPIGIIKGRKHLTEEISNLNSDLEATREQSRAIRAKYLAGGKKITNKDKGQLDLLSRKEKVLSRQGKRLNDQQSGWRKIVGILKPFGFLFGFVFIIVSLLLVASIFLTSVDKAVNSTNFCGAQCGFVLAYPKIFNPLDRLLTILSSFFPLDYVLLITLILYIFFASLSGIVSIGIRFLWVHLYSIRPHTTPPQGLLLTSALLMFIILALNMEITTLSPQYASFGSQMYKPENSTELQPCSLNAPTEQCTITQIGQFINHISVRTSFFGVIYFALNWIFILVWVIGLIVAVVKSKKSNIEEHETDSEEEEN